MWSRRQFGAAGMVGLSALGLETQAIAAEAPEEGFEFLRLKTPVPRMATQRVEVVKFFRYGCPFCAQFEPMVEKWRQQLPADVSFQYIPVSFHSTAHQQLHLTLRQMGQVGRLHMAVYDGVHREGQHFELLKDISEWVHGRGVDPIAFEMAWHSREVAKAMVQANAIVNAYGVTSVPQFGVAGLYRTSPTMAGGSNARVLEVVTYLLEQVRHS